MAIAALELMGFFLGIFGMFGTLVATLLPYWATSAHIGANIVTAVENVKGLWMECVHQSTGAFQCETYNSILGLTADLQAARAMMVISLMFSVMALAVSTIGMQCTVCMDGSSVKSKVAGVGGSLFLLAGLLSLIPVSWKTHEVVQTFYTNNIPPSLKFEIGNCLYVGLASSLMSMLGGGLLSASCCDDLDGGRGTRRQYPYPDRTGFGMSRGATHSMPYHPPILQSAANHNVANKSQTLNSQTSTSTHSAMPAPAHDSRKSTRQNTAAGYDVTGYV
ncbi:claudin-14-like [Myxocyprinus asiaticus]|uniref:claudin-14-like n=1 Tax=Myxocyprinus asiaticus TaxID=70543 RepID=UPI0022226A59|nr:claudin-14-like [Myxocyprinus asiaticus]XP_051536824.1 claudin-14-like [Myxocyprinus asiaticus]XP_051536825.1 claudin-14-like [Myxocyprinus asiaticus]